MKEKLFVLGIGGLTGSKLSEVARDDFEIFGSYNFRDPKLSFVKSFNLDITNTSKIEQILEEIKPDVVINTTGINNVDYCEKHPELGEIANIDTKVLFSEYSENIMPQHWLKIAQTIKEYSEIRYSTTKYCAQSIINDHA